MPKIFISYRREDSQWPTDRLYEAISAHVEQPKNDVFIDIDNIPLGINFVQHLESKVSQCDVLLAIIGPSWLTVRDPKSGLRRLEDPQDFVRIEIAAALKRGVPVIPVLLDEAPIPVASELPEDLRELASRNGVQVRRLTFKADVDRLLRGLNLLPETSSLIAASSKSKSSARRPARKAQGLSVGVGLAVLAVMILGGAGAAFFLLDPLKPFRSIDGAPQDLGAVIAADTAPSEKNPVISSSAPSATTLEDKGPVTSVASSQPAAPVASTLDPSQPDSAPSDPPAPKPRVAKQSAPPSDPCAGARLDLERAENATTKDIVEAYLSSVPSTCTVQIAIAQKRLDALQIEEQARIVEAERQRKAREEAAERARIKKEQDDRNYNQLLADARSLRITGDWCEEIGRTVIRSSFNIDGDGRVCWIYNTGQPESCGWIVSVDTSNGRITTAHVAERPSPPFPPDMFKENFYKDSRNDTLKINQGDPTKRCK